MKFKNPILLESTNPTDTVYSGATKLFFYNGDLYMRKNTDNTKLSNLTNYETTDLVIGANYIGVESPPTNGALVEGKVGIGGTNPTSSLHIYGSFSVNTETITNSNYTQTNNDAVILFSTGSLNRTLTLQNSVEWIGRQVWVKKIDSGVGQVIIDPFGSQTIEGLSTYTISNQYASICIASSGGQIHIVGSHGI